MPIATDTRTTTGRDAFARSVSCRDVTTMYIVVAAVSGLHTRTSKRLTRNASNRQVVYNHMGVLTRQYDAIRLHAAPRSPKCVMQTYIIGRIKIASQTAIRVASFGWPNVNTTYIIFEFSVCSAPHTAMSLIRGIVASHALP